MSVKQAINKRNEAKSQLANVQGELTNAQFASASQRDVIMARIHDLKSQKTELESKLNVLEVEVLNEIDKESIKAEKKKDKKDEQVKQKLYEKIKKGLKGTNLQKGKIETAKFVAGKNSEKDDKPYEQKGIPGPKDTRLAYGIEAGKQKKAIVSDGYRRKNDSKGKTG